MALSAADVMDVDKLYEFGERLAASDDKSKCVSDYTGIIDGVKKGNSKAKQLAAQLIPRFFKFFPELQRSALDSQFDLLEEEDLGTRIQAVRGLALIGKETPDFVPRILDIIVQLLIYEDNVERDAVHKAMMSLVRQDTKASLAALFKNVETSSETVRDKIISFLKDKVFPHKAELLKPQEEMERYITDLIKKSLQDVTGAEFKLFMDFLNSLRIFGDGAPVERVQELTEIIEGQADLDAQFDVEDVDHIDRFISCMQMALPFFTRGASSNRFLNYLNKHILPVFDKLPEERMLDLLKNFAVSSSYAIAQDARLLLPSVVQLLQKYMPRKKEETNINYIECLLYAFHHLAHKSPNSTNSLCGYKIVTGQPSDRLGEDFSENYKDFTARLSTVEEVVKAKIKKLTQALGDHKKAISGAKTDEAKANIKKEQQEATVELRICNSILAMTQPLHAKAPSFIGDNKINLSWKGPSSKSSASTTTLGSKRNVVSTDASNTKATGNKKIRSEGPGSHQLVNRSLEGMQAGGRRNRRRGRSSGGRERGWGGYRQFR